MGVQVKRLWDRSLDQQIDYHLHDGRAINMTFTQSNRVELAKTLVRMVLEKTPGPATIVELGCGAGDISGPFSNEGHHVLGVDVVPAAGQACAERWPSMEFQLGRIEDVTPRQSTMLILCETLEHLTYPMAIIQAWLPLADWVLISHPLHEPNPPYESGHLWSYDEDDFNNWFPTGGHERLPGWTFTFEMGTYKTMIAGLGKRQGS